MGFTVSNSESVIEKRATVPFGLSVAARGSLPVGPVRPRERLSVMAGTPVAAGWFRRLRAAFNVFASCRASSSITGATHDVDVFEAYG